MARENPRSQGGDGNAAVSSGWVKIFGKPLEKTFDAGYVPQRESVDWDFPVSVMDVVLRAATEARPD